MAGERQDGPLAIIGVVLGLIGSGVGTWATIDKQKQADEIAGMQVKLQERQDVRQERGAERDYMLKVTERVIDAMGSGSAQQQDVARVLINTLADSEVKRQLQNALVAAAVPAVKDKLQKTITREAQFAAVDAAPTPAATASKVAVDIFWCEGPGAPGRQAQAEQLRTAAEAAGSFGRLRVRPLPESVNLRPGYGIFSNIIRHQYGERAEAADLQKLQPSLGSQQISYNTPNYISAFFCAVGN